jgi:short-subunit dehydrogenase
MPSETERSLALVTGGSSGIGLELARQCLDNGYDVLLVADVGLGEAVEQLSAGPAVTPLVADLTTHEGNERVVEAVAAQSAPLELLLLNAGVAVGGPFLETPLGPELALIQLNISSVVHLAKRLLPQLVERGQGRTLITASIAGTMPGPYYATYAASKAFLISFAEAIRYELKDTGVTVTALLPGPTDTEFFDRSDMVDTPVGQGPKDDPAEVAADGFKALMKGEHQVVAGSAKNSLQAATARVLPDSVKAAMHAKQTQPQGS